MKLLGKDKFRYFLTYRSVRTQIYLSPRGWDTNSKVRYSRNKEYFGVFRSWALPLDFVYDGADLLRKAYYNGSIETAVKIEVEELNDQTLKYELGFVGDIDFSGKKDDGTVFSVTLMESGPGAKIQAYDDLKNEFPLVGDDVVTMILPGIVFTEASDSIFIPFVDTPPKRYIPETSLVTEGFQSGFADVQSTSREAMTDNGFETSVNWFAKANRDVSLKVKGSISGTYRSFPFTDNTGFRVELTNSDKSDVRLLYNSPTGGRNDYNFQFDYDETFDMVDGERLFFYVRNNSTSSAQSIQINDGSLNVSYEDVSDPSECKGLRAIDLFKRIMNKVAPGYAADSSLLSAGRWKDLIFTCGDGIREIDAAKIKWSLSDMFKTINGIDDAALGIDNEVTRIENGYYFARNAQICSVGVVSSCELDPATEFMFSKLKTGYKDGNTDDLNGKEEYNSEQEWQSPITRVQTPQDWTSAARADQFGIEKLRTEYNIKKTTKGTYDIGSDNDVFMFDCYLDGDVYRPVLGSTYDIVTGLSSPDSAYNLDLSPKANLLRKGSYLAGVFHNMQSLYINFASATKNAELSVTKNGIVVKQNTAIPINSLPSPYFLPEVAKIKCKLPVAARQMFASNPFGFIHFVFKDTNFYGYILDAAIDIARNTEQEFQLLLTPNTFLPGYVNKVKNIGKQDSGSVPSGLSVQFEDSPYLFLLAISIDGGPPAPLNSNPYEYLNTYEISIASDRGTPDSFGIIQFIFEGVTYYGDKDTASLLVNSDHPLYNKTPIEIGINAASQTVNLRIGEFNNSIVNPLTTLNGAFNGFRLQDTSTIEYQSAGDTFQTLGGALTIYGAYFRLYLFSTDRNFTADILVNGDLYALESQFSSDSGAYIASCLLLKSDYIPAELTVDITITD